VVGLGLALGLGLGIGLGRRPISSGNLPTGRKMEFARSVVSTSRDMPRL